MVLTHRLDGVVLDLEPFGRDDARYLSLLQKVRAELPDTRIGVTAPLDRWSGTFAVQVGSLVDAVLPMAYDTTLPTEAEYVATVSTSVADYRAALGSGPARLLPVL